MLFDELHKLKNVGMKNVILKYLLVYGIHRNHVLIIAQKRRYVKCMIRVKLRRDDSLRLSLHGKFYHLVKLYDVVTD
jgi:hypothetical protein